jgi:CheY-like chemotaxis protein
MKGLSMDTTKQLALIIEDNRDQNLTFTTALEQAGYQAESIFDGDIALERLNNLVPDVIVLDLHLPGTNGSVILNQIRNDQRFYATRVILATADSALANTLQFQTELILLKPISFSLLKQLVARYLQSPKEANDSSGL